MQAGNNGRKRAAARYFGGEDNAAPTLTSGSELSGGEGEDSWEGKAEAGQPSQPSAKRPRPTAAADAATGAVDGHSGAGECQQEQRQAAGLEPSFLLGSYVALD